jgi:hypothetical protein
MVDDKGDIPDRGDVEPYDNQIGQLLDELLYRGETQVHLSNGQHYELHGYDTYLFLKPKSSRPGIVYTQNEDEDEVWFRTDEIVSLEQH